MHESPLPKFRNVPPNFNTTVVLRVRVAVNAWEVKLQTEEVEMCQKCMIQAYSVDDNLRSPWQAANIYNSRGG